MGVNLPEIKPGSGKHGVHDFGEYKGISIVGNRVDIRESNMKQNFENIQKGSWKADLLESRDYMRAASKLAKEITEELPLSDETLGAFKAVCLRAAADQELTKGSLAVGMFMGIRNRNVGKKAVIEKRFGLAIISLRKEGYSIRKIAEMLEINKNTVNKIIKNNISE